MSSSHETFVAVKASTIFEAIQKAYAACASIDHLADEQSLLEISYNEYMRLQAINRLKFKST